LALGGTIAYTYTHMPRIPYMLYYYYYYYYAPCAKIIKKNKIIRHVCTYVVAVGSLFSADPAGEKKSSRRDKLGFPHYYHTIFFFSFVFPDSSVSMFLWRSDNTALVIAATSCERDRKPHTNLQPDTVPKIHEFSIPYTEFHSIKYFKTIDRLICEWIQSRYYTLFIWYCAFHICYCTYSVSNCIFFFNFRPLARRRTTLQVYHVYAYNTFIVYSKSSYYKVHNIIL